MTTVAPIYVGLNFPDRLGPLPRLMFVAISCVALAVLLTAAWLTPDPRGFGTHEALGLQPCGFYMQTGIPCPGCGMTTSFAYGIRGHFVSAFVAQPFGLLLCLLTAAAFWSAAYVAVTGRPAYRLFALVPQRTHLIVWPLLAVAGWAWKIALTLGHF